MGQFEYSVELAAKPDELGRIALAFKAGEQKERDRVAALLENMGKSASATNGLGSLVWTTPLIDRLKLR